jgi:N-methylhydantoinase A
VPDPVRVGIDTGGTFTDFVVARGGHITAFKIASTPHNPAEAILSGIASIVAGLQEWPEEIIHGTTVATNALLERKGAPTALITTEGFEDVIEIGRQARPELYNFMVKRSAPLVARDMRFGLAERIGPEGETITPLDQQSLSKIVSRIAQSGAEAVAVSLLFSFANPAHEQAVARALDKLALPVSVSHRILPEYREYERTSTVVINAYLVPLMSRYLKSLADGLGSGVRDSDLVNLKFPVSGGPPPAPGSLRVMQSNGGSVSAATAAAEPVRAILSGPAGGVVGALKIAAAAGVKDIITFDMGGTSTDVALCQGEARATNEALVAGLPVAVPVIDIHTVGAGGGSIARLDEAGALRVGPESAGADPGPVCYGQGEQVTVTDANLVLGRLGGAGLLGGEMRIDEERARYYLSKLAAEMSRFSDQTISPERAALGVIRVANANMESALRVVSVERGRDPRLFTLVSFGGAGGLHVCDLAAALKVPRIIVPRSPGTLSALGVLLGDVVKDYSRTVMIKMAGTRPGWAERAFKELEREAIKDMRAEGFRPERVKLARSAAVRYVGQSFEIDVAWSKRVDSVFHSAHRERYGYCDAKRPIEIVSLRVRATGVTKKPRLRRAGARTTRAVAAHNTARVFFGERPRQTAIYKRDDLGPGDRIDGPAVITEYSSTTLVLPGWTAKADPWLNLIITQATA